MYVACEGESTDWASALHTQSIIKSSALNLTSGSRPFSHDFWSVLGQFCTYRRAVPYGAACTPRSAGFVRVTCCNIHVITSCSEHHMPTFDNRHPPSFVLTQLFAQISRRMETARTRLARRESLGKGKRRLERARRVVHSLRESGRGYVGLVRGPP